MAALTRQLRKLHNRLACQAAHLGSENVSASMASGEDVADGNRVELPRGWLVGVLPLLRRPA